MMQPAYTDGWTPAKVIDYLLSNPGYVEWRSIDGDSPYWISADGTLYGMMDDDDARAFATWKFVADRGQVTRAELLEAAADQDTGG